MAESAKNVFETVKKLFEAGERGKRRKVKVPDGIHCRDIRNITRTWWPSSNIDSVLSNIDSVLDAPSNFYLYLYEKQFEKNRLDVKNMLKEMFNAEPEKIFEIEETATSMRIKYKRQNTPAFYSFDVRPLKFVHQETLIRLEEQLDITLRLLYSDDHVWEVREHEKECEEYIEDIVDLINEEIKNRLTPTEAQIKMAVKYGDFGKFMFRFDDVKDDIVYKVYSKDGYSYDNTPLKKH